MDELSILVNDLIQTTGCRNDEPTRMLMRERIMQWYKDMRSDSELELTAYRTAEGRRAKKGRSNHGNV